MGESPSVPRTLLPLAVLDLVVVSWITPPDPITQLLWTGGGLIVAAGVAYWFVRDGAERLDATVSDVWLFVVSILGVVVLGVLFVPDPVLTPLQTAVLAVVATVVAGWVAFAADTESIRAFRSSE